MNAHAVNRMGRLGVGVSNQLSNDLSSLSFKLQKSQSFAFGGVLGLSTDDNHGGHGFGVKAYKIFYDEPQLNFYGSVLGALISKKIGGESDSGFQIDFTFGSEFHFTGLYSLGLSFEFGISLNKMDEFVIETVGDHFVSAGIHFYL